MRANTNSNRRELFSQSIAPTFFPSVLRRVEESTFVQVALIVEFRDEAFVEIRSRLEDCGWQVVRAEHASDVAARMHNDTPQLVLVSEEMPDESGCLITHKLRQQHCLPVVWLYTSRRKAIARGFGKFCGVDKVLQYNGDLQRLGVEIQGRLERRLNATADSDILRDSSPNASA